MRVRLTSAAHRELAAALDWYDQQGPGLAPRFLAEHKALLARLAETPHLFPAIRRDVRRAGFHHFPYGLFFRIRPDVVEVFACFHASRDPIHWQRRQ